MFNDDHRYIPVPEWNPTDGGGGGGSSIWGSITGNINNQTDLQQSLAGKLNKLTDAGEFVYTHEGAIQNSKGFIAGDTLLNSSAHIPSAHTVKKYVDDSVQAIKLYEHTICLWNDSSKTNAVIIKVINNQTSPFSSRTEFANWCIANSTGISRSNLIQGGYNNGSQTLISIYFSDNNTMYYSNGTDWVTTAWGQYFDDTVRQII